MTAHAALTMVYRFIKEEVSENDPLMGHCLFLARKKMIFDS